MFGFGNYIYVSVCFRIGGQPYSYRTTDASIQKGDMVVVPVGSGEKVGVVTAVNKYKKSEVPFPVEKTKLVIRKATEPEKAVNTNLDARVPMDISCASIKTADGIKVVVLNQAERDAMRKGCPKDMLIIEKYPVSMAGKVIREYKNGK